jgi:hypothetical protein
MPAKPTDCTAVADTQAWLIRCTVATLAFIFAGLCSAPPPKTATPETLQLRRKRRRPGFNLPAMERNVTAPVKGMKRINCSSASLSRKLSVRLYESAKFNRCVATTVAQP